VAAAGGLAHAQPANDLCANAIPITQGTTSYTNAGANNDGPAACGAFGADIWYIYTATASGTVELVTCTGTGYDSTLAAYAGSTCPAGAQLACNDDSCGLQSRISFQVGNGQRYLIRVGGFASQTGSGVLTLSLDGSSGPPANDACANASTASNGSTPFNTIDATTDQGIPTSCTVGQDVWFRYTATDTGNTTISTCAATNFDTVLAVYAGSTCPSSAPLACNDNSCGIGSSVTVALTQGSTYMIRVGGAGTAMGGGSMLIRPPGATGGVGPDVQLSSIAGITNWGTLNGTRAYSLGSGTCNNGTENLHWGNSFNGTPALAMNAYRLYQGRLLQVGLGFCKYSCCAAAGSGCLVTPCNGVGGSNLGVGCLDVYGSGYNGSQGLLGPRSAINAFTGTMTYIGGSGTVIDRRLQVRESDMSAANFPNALYFVEGVYVGTDDAQWGNGTNNATYQRVTVSGLNYDLGQTGTTYMGVPAIRAWRDHGLGVGIPDPSVQIVNADVPAEGRFVVGAKATDLGGGRWRYDYAVFNINSSRSGGSFSVAVPASDSVTNIGFHDVDYHSGEVYSNTDWTSSVANGRVTWTSPQTHAQNPNANALRWGTMYNFWFDSSAATTTGAATLGLFVPGTPTEVQAAGIPVPTVGTCAVDLNGDGVANVQDFLTFLALFADGDPRAEFTGDGQINLQDLLAFLSAYAAGC
jgi:hypothetical protein